MAPRRDKKKRKSMRDRTRQKANESGSFVADYIKLPQGIELFDLEEAIKEDKRSKKVPIDIIPFEVTQRHPFDEDSPGEMIGDLWWRFRIYVHSQIGAEEKKYACLRTFGKKCPICQERKRLMDADEEEKLVENLRATTRELYFISNDGMKTAQLWDMSHYLFMKGLDKEVKTGDEELADFNAVEGGFTVITRFSEEKYKGGTYYAADRYDFESRDDVPDKLIDSLPDPASCVIELSFDKLQAILYDTDDGSDDTGEDDTGEDDTGEDDTGEDDTGEEDTGEEDDQGAGEPIEEEVEEEVVEEKKAPVKKSSKKKAAAEEEIICPCEGGEFGVEWDEWEECDGCEFNDQCKAEGTRLRKLKKDK